MVIIDSGAAFSRHREYRYQLWRIWNPKKSFLMVIGLNPSTADETEDDPTIKRCIRFAYDWGYGGLRMFNLFAFRATDPKIMLLQDNPVGKSNDIILKTSASKAGMVLAAWGNAGKYKNRDMEVIHLLDPIKNIYCLGRTQAGYPRHPLYIKASTKPIRYVP